MWCLAAESEISRPRIAISWNTAHVRSLTRLRTASWMRLACSRRWICIEPGDCGRVVGVV